MEVFKGFRKIPRRIKFSAAFLTLGAGIADYSNGYDSYIQRVIHQVIGIPYTGVVDAYMRNVPELREIYKRFKQCVPNVNCWKRNKQEILKERDRVVKKYWSRVFDELSKEENWKNYVIRDIARKTCPDFPTYVKTACEDAKAFWENYRKLGENMRFCSPKLRFYWVNETYHGIKEDWHKGLNCDMTLKRNK